MHTPPLSKSATPLRPAATRRVDTGLDPPDGLHVLETPDRKELPTLTDLLASSRRSKLRPRPPSRKHHPLAVDTMAPDEPSIQAGDGTNMDVLPVLSDGQAVPDVSPAKTYFSSPASGSSQSTPENHRRRPRSPISPLFGTGRLDISGFSPPFTSTQHREPGSPHQGAFKKGGFGGAGAGESQSQRAQVGLERGSSGFFGMYNSQFDVEAQVGQVSDLLDRDVDFNEYLRDVDEMEKADEQDGDRDEEIAV